MGWGGRRRGAGAPMGNFNALKHGACSEQLLALLQKLSQDPAFIRLAAMSKKRAANPSPRPNATEQRRLRKIGRALDLYMDVLGVNVGRSTQKARENARRLKEIIVEEQLRISSNQVRKIDSFDAGGHQDEKLPPPPSASDKSVEGPKSKKFSQVHVPNRCSRGKRSDRSC